MDRRYMLASAGAVVLAGAAARGAFGQEVGAVSKPTALLDKMHQDCLDICQRCEATCNVTLHYCMTHLANGHKEHAACAALAMSCQDFCGLSAKIIARSCTLTSAACEACAKACEACATECEKMKSDEQMAACAKQCRECAASCRKMI
ncbi:MAG: four-helix bundle copper-binding protein [Planctomycetaceae bacterium]|jgi:hypothetical protein|nr:four-helix bundle copper-binding protein [Planctomycetaceae bacterium]